jgi:hypothetical protein
LAGFIKSQTKDNGLCSGFAKHLSRCRQNDCKRNSGYPTENLHAGTSRDRRDTVSLCRKANELRLKRSKPYDGFDPGFENRDRGNPHCYASAYYLHFRKFPMTLWLDIRTYPHFFSSSLTPSASRLYFIHPPSFPSVTHPLPKFTRLVKLGFFLGRRPLFFTPAG